MEPGGLALPITAVITASSRTAENIHGLEQEIENIPTVLTLIRTEILTMVGSLRRLETTLTDRPKLLQSRFQSDDEGLEIFDGALTDCMTVISCIEFELERLFNNDSMTWATAFRYLWSESNVKDLQQHLNGQRGALQLLLQSLEV